MKTNRNYTLSELALSSCTQLGLDWDTVMPDLCQKFLAAQMTCAVSLPAHISMAAQRDQLSDDLRSRQPSGQNGWWYAKFQSPVTVSPYLPFSGARVVVVLTRVTLTTSTSANSSFDACLAVRGRIMKEITSINVQISCHHTCFSQVSKWLPCTLIRATLTASTPANSTDACLSLRGWITREFTSTIILTSYCIHHTTTQHWLWQDRCGRASCTSQSAEHPNHHLLQDNRGYYVCVHI